MMLVNYQKSGHLGQGCSKDWRETVSRTSVHVLSHTTKTKNQHFTSTTLKFGLAKCSFTISYVFGHPSGPRQLALAQQDRATKSGNQQLGHVTHIWDQSLRVQQFIILRWSHCQVTKVPFQSPHITTEYSADIRNRTLRARVSIHIQKRKPPASIRNKIKKFHKLFNAYTTFHKDDMGRAIAMPMLPLPPIKPITLPWQRGFSWGGKKKSMISHILKREECYMEIGLMTVAETQDLLSGMPLVLLRTNDWISQKI